MRDLCGIIQRGTKAIKEAKQKHIAGFFQDSFRVKKEICNP